MTPYEGLQGMKPTLEHFRVFGCVAHVKIPTNKLTKLGDRSEQMVYLGNEVGSKAFRLYCPKRNRIYVSRDVVFEEKRKWDWAKVLCEGPILSNSWVRFPSEGIAQDTMEELDPTLGEIGSPSSPPHGYQSSTTPADHSPPVSEVPISPGDSTSLASEEDVDRSTYDDTPVRGFRALTDIYNETQEMEDDSEMLMYAGEEPTTYEEASGDKE